MSLDVTALHDAVLGILRAIPNLNVMDGSVDDAGEAAPTLDPDGRAHMYAVLYAGLGHLTPGSLTGSPDQLDYGFQVQCCGGDTGRARMAGVKVRAALTGTRLTPTSGLTVERTDPGSPREDPSVAPSRWFVPFLFTALNVRP